MSHVVVNGDTLAVLTSAEAFRVRGVLERAVLDAQRAGTPLHPDAISAMRSIRAAADAFSRESQSRQPSSTCQPPADPPVSYYLGTVEYAEMIGVTPATVRNRIKAGVLAGVKQAGRWLVVLEDVE